MVLSFRHKGLRRFFEHDDRSKVSPDMAERIALILGVLHAARNIDGINVPTFRLHPLKGKLKGSWAVTVRANWRITFRFENGNAFEVDLVDYH